VASHLTAHANKGFIVLWSGVFAGYFVNAVGLKRRGGRACTKG